MATIEDWTTYWRNTLADGERNEIDPSTIDRNKVLFIKPEQISFKLGKIDKSLADKLFAYLNKQEEEEEDEFRITTVPVLLSLFSISPIADSAIESGERKMFPFWIKAVLKMDSSLQPDEESFPYIPRVFLEPQLSEKYFYTFSDVETIDQCFYQLDYEKSNWAEYWDYIQDIFRNITGQEISEYKIEDYLTQYGVTLIVNDSLKGASDGIIKLYDFISKNNSYSKLYERLADENSPSNKKIRDISDNEDDTLCHYGQMNYEFPMSFSQRDAMYHFIHCKDGEVFALNGPPGTGKTTLLQSVVANEFVKKAI